MKIKMKDLEVIIKTCKTKIQYIRQKVSDRTRNNEYKPKN